VPQHGKNGAQGAGARPFSRTEEGKVDAMRKTGLMVALVAVMAALFATAAYAATIEGNNNNNVLHETAGSDILRGFGGNDTLDANNFGGDEDILRGGSGNDVLLANDGDSMDLLFGGPGFDICVVDDRSEIGGGCEKIRVRADANPGA
jgi:Ca2+-binding RTX toxin-like protein